MSPECKNRNKDISNSTIQERRMMKLLILISFVSIVMTLYGINNQIYFTATTPHHVPHYERLVQNVSFEHPFVYPHRVDLRIIVLTKNRTNSLKILLKSVENLITDGDKVSVEIWIDRDDDNIIHGQTLELANNFSRRNNHINVYAHSKHVGLYDQWLSTYSSKHLLPDENEIVLFLEDDLTISKYSYKWLKAVHSTFQDEPDYLGISLRSHDKIFPLQRPVPSNHSVFKFRIFSTHGFSPKLKVWDKFQKWFVEHIHRKDFKPYVPNIKPTKWYMSFEKKNIQLTMWSIWFLYYSYIEQLFAVYPTSEFYQKFYNIKNNDTMFTFIENRQEIGLHFTLKDKTGNKVKLIHSWDKSFIEFPTNISKYDWQGQSI